MSNRVVPKILYGVLFCALLPALLVLWTQHVTVNIPLGEWETPGRIMTGVGAIVLLWGMVDLWRRGKGLPMNAFPPEYYVQQGSYALFRHPIYTGFCLGCAGVSCMAASPAGLYLITPVMVIACWALVQGYEQPDLEKRFGKVRHTSMFSLPADLEEPASLREKLYTAAGVFTVWIVLYEVLIAVGVGENYFDTVLEFEKTWGVSTNAELWYFVTYIFVAVAPFLARSQRQLRLFALDAWGIVSVGLFLQLILPLYASPRPIVADGFLSDLMQWERSVDGPAAAFPSFHVMWALVAAAAWTRRNPLNRGFWFAMAGFIAWSCHATGVHSMADIVAGALVYCMVRGRTSLWNFLQRVSQYLANSWTSWTFGGFRIINHSIYAGLAGAVGVGIVSLFVNEPRVLLVITLSTLLGGAVWGQWVEGSSKLLRPFGYYGAIIGGIVGLFICDVALHFPWQKSIGAFALASPWTQAVGRLRCLVQGCCHGRITDPGLGIVYWNDHSRVCKVSQLKGSPLHNTQLYSILSNVVIGLLLARLWYGGASPTMLAGLYLILNGAARFVEESYRGETQTSVIGNMPIYQWIAIGSMMLGALLTTVNSAYGLAMDTHLSTQMVGVMVFGGVASAFAMGMDFPRSNVPFSRLSG